jgi:hypothetical protein
VIRRGFWLVAGAVLGVTGYRRATRLVRAVAPAVPARTGSAGGDSSARTADRRPLLTGRAVLAGAARAGRGVAQGAAFVRDVSDGMAEYWDRQGRHTLDSETRDREQQRAALRGQRGRPAP